MVLMEKYKLEYYDYNTNSDKVYIIYKVQRSSSMWAVECKYGRNDESKELRFVEKTSYAGVPLGEANDIVNKLIEQKLKKGYELC